MTRPTRDSNEGQLTDHPIVADPEGNTDLSDRQPTIDIQLPKPIVIDPLIWPTEPALGQPTSDRPYCHAELLRHVGLTESANDVH